jgi:hypothetical protein
MRRIAQRKAGCAEVGDELAAVEPLPPVSDDAVPQ